MTTMRNKTRKANPAQLTINNEMRGSLKSCAPSTTGNPNPPEFAGSCTINGESYWISGWVNRGGAKPVLDLVFQLAVPGSAPHRFKPDDLRLRTAQREKPTQRDKDWSHYMQAPPAHRESGHCPRCNRVRESLEHKFGKDPPF